MISSPPYPTAQLVEGGETKAIGILDHDDVGRGDVQAYFDHAGGNENLGEARAKALHVREFFLILHFAMHDVDGLFWEGFFEFGLEVFERLEWSLVLLLGLLDERGDEKDLIPFFYLGFEPGIRVKSFGFWDCEGFDGKSTTRQLGEVGDVKLGKQSLCKTARDGGGGHHK